MLWYADENHRNQLFSHRRGLILKRFKMNESARGQKTV